MSAALPATATPPATVPSWLKLGWTVWLLVWAPVYASYYGFSNFVWFCDISNVVIGVALWRPSALLFSWQAVSVLIVQLVWTVDLIGRLVLGQHLIGGTEYMFEQSIPLPIRLLSLFHAAAPPVLVYGLRAFGYDRRAWALQTATSWVVLPVSYLLGPSLDLNWVYGPFDEPQTWMPPLAYLGACMLLYPIVVFGLSHLILNALFGRRRRLP